MGLYNSSQELFIRIMMRLFIMPCHNFIRKYQGEKGLPAINITHQKYFASCNKISPPPSEDPWISRHKNAPQCSSVILHLLKDPIETAISHQASSPTPSLLKPLPRKHTTPEIQSCPSPSGACSPVFCSLSPVNHFMVSVDLEHRIVSNT